MDTLSKFSPAQSLLLRTAARRADGRVIPPDTLRGGAPVKVLTALLQRGWIEPAADGCGGSRLSHKSGRLRQDWRCGQT